MALAANIMGPQGPAGPPGGSEANVVLRDVPCDVSVIVTDAVKMVGGTAYKALADSVLNSNHIGIVEAKTSPTLCDIRVLGVTEEIFVGLDESKEYYLSDTTPGAVGTIVPTTSGHVIVKIGQPFSSTRMLVLKGNRMVRG